MKRNILGFFMLATFYLVILTQLLNVGLELLAFFPFYMNFILICSMFPTLYLAFVRAISSNMKGTVLIVNTIHIAIMSVFILIVGSYTTIFGEADFTFGFVFLIIMFVINILFLLREIKRKWVLITIVVFVLILISYYSSGMNLLDYVMNHRIISAYLVVQNVISVSYLFLRERY